MPGDRSQQRAASTSGCSTNENELMLIDDSAWKLHVRINAASHFSDLSYITYNHALACEAASPVSTLPPSSSKPRPLLCQLKSHKRKTSEPVAVQTPRNSLPACPCHLFPRSPRLRSYRMSSYDKVVKAATKPKAGAPKPKHMDPIIASSFSSDGSLQDITRSLGGRLREPSSIVGRAG